MATAEYYAAHREAIRERQREYYRRNKEYFTAKNKRYRQDNSAAIRRYRKKTKVRRAAINAAWCALHRPELAAKMRLYRRTRPDLVRASEKRRKRPRGHREAFNIYRQVWGRANPEKLQQYYQSRRARKSGAGNTLTATEIKDQRIKQAGRCWYCKGALDNRGRGHVDHLTPLYRGGQNAAKNIVIACASCNLRKGRRTAAEFRAVLQSTQARS